MLSAEIERRARALLDHRLRRVIHPVPPAAEWPADIDIAYAIQDAADALLRSEHGYVPIGYKIAGTNPAARAHLKIAAPFHGRLYDRQAADAPAGPTDITFLRVHEPEIALVIGRDLPPGEAPFSAETVAAATRAVLPAVEIIGTPFDPWSQAGATNLASDNAAFGFWIRGAPVNDFAHLDLQDGVITLSVNGEEKARGRGGNVDGGPFGATAWLANDLAARGRGLKAGDYVTTGSVTPPVPVAPGQAVVADFGPLGQVAFSLPG